jgi:hypothetical protein
MKPNPELPIIFAKTIMGELAHIRATIDGIAELVALNCAKKNNVDIKDMQTTFKIRRDEKTALFYQNHLKKLGFDKDE